MLIRSEAACVIHVGVGCFSVQYINQGGRIGSWSSLKPYMRSGRFSANWNQFRSQSLAELRSSRSVTSYQPSWAKYNQKVEVLLEKVPTAIVHKILYVFASTLSNFLPLHTVLKLLFCIYEWNHKLKSYLDTLSCRRKLHYAKQCQCL